MPNSRSRCVPSSNGSPRNVRVDSNAMSPMTSAESKIEIRAQDSGTNSPFKYTSRPDIRRSWLSTLWPVPLKVYHPSDMLVSMARWASWRSAPVSSIYNRMAWSLSPRAGQAIAGGVRRLARAFDAQHRFGDHPDVAGPLGYADNVFLGIMLRRQFHGVLLRLGPPDHDVGVRFDLIQSHRHHLFFCWRKSIPRAENLNPRRGKCSDQCPTRIIAARPNSHHEGLLPNARGRMPKGNVRHPLEFRKTVGRCARQGASRRFLRAEPAASALPLTKSHLWESHLDHSPFRPRDLSQLSRIDVNP